MATIGAPSISVSFTEAAASTISLSSSGISSGIIGLVIKDTVNAGAKTIYNTAGIPDDYTEENIGYIKDCFKGYVNAPTKVIVYTLVADGGTVDYNEALNYFATAKANWLAFPYAETDGVNDDIASWVKSMRTTEHKPKKAVLSNADGADNEGIVNVAMDGVDEDGNTVTAAQLVARIAGILAGTPYTMSCTYATISELADCTLLASDELDEAVNSGKLVFMNDGEKVKIVRGVNSLVTTTSEKGDSFRKIKIVDVIDQITEDITTTVQDSYIGKYNNSYDNKCLLISAISSYLKTCYNEGMLANGGSVAIDADAQRDYLEGLGKDVVLEDGSTKSAEECSDDEISRANSGTQVFLTITISILDAMEDFTVEVHI